MSTEEKWMLEALELARQGEGLTRPNPPVGAVIVKGGRKIGEGYHRRSGGLHAEVAAIRHAQEPVEGADIYVTLEPCSTLGRTPPCTDAIIEAGIKRTIVSVEDPNPHHAGRGLEILRRAKIEVELGLCSEEAMRIKEPFAKWILTARPWVTLKLGMSADARIADSRGRSKWITSAASRARVQELRRKSDAIMVGADTALADDPALTPRPAYGREPYRVVLDSRGRLPASLRIFRDGAVDRTIVATTAASPADWRRKIELAGAQVWVLPSRGGRVSLKTLMKKLGEIGLLHVLCEGGGELAAALAEQGLIDEYRLFSAPCLLGGAGRPAFGGGWPLSNKPELEYLEYEELEGDLLIRARPRPR